MVTFGSRCRWPCGIRCGRDRFAVAGLALRSSADDGEDSTPPRLEVCHQAGTGGAAGGMDRAVRQTSGKNPVDRGRWRIHQGSVLEARGGGRRDDRGPAAERRRPARSAWEAPPRPESETRPSTQIWQAQDQPRQAGWPQAGLARTRLHDLRPNGRQDLQNVSRHLSFRGRRDSRGADSGGAWLVRFVLHRSQRHPAGDRRGVCRSGDHRTGFP